ncbi:MAG: hypothetical protein IJQ15_03115 [Synergistaceae bacterium]|nr:hypothetical protein [Synergistaceae bacterium]MBQ3758989.1 hypothetical protein [Synergistaceae bacterium]MBQ6665411.1 hypothetical protein [Synergistaceae bacterium]MBQ6981405.1 hypothetical protein [Synergistaceae bacterium]MBR0184585.1 hypothetical protein [Synergistaceae bacterium]
MTDMWENFKLRLYLETTTFNWFIDPRPGHEDVVRLFEAVKAGQFVGYTSRYVTDELDKAEEPKRTNMLNLIDEYGIIMLSPRIETEMLAGNYIEEGIIPKSQMYDSLHIALASLHELDAIVSYNFHHINREKTKALIPEINSHRNLKGIMFFTAEEVFDYYEQFFRGRGTQRDGPDRG